MTSAATQQEANQAPILNIYPLNDEQVVSGRACSPQMLGSLVRGLALLLLIEVASGFVSGNHGALLSRRAYTSRVSTGACASLITLARNCQPMSALDLSCCQNTSR